MKNARVSYRSLPEHLRDYSSWPPADFSQLEESEKIRAERLSAGIAHYLQTGMLKNACEVAHCSGEALLAQLSRCIHPDAAGESVIGWAALTPHRRVDGYTRKADSSGARKLGFAGSFRKFLEGRADVYQKLKSLVRNGAVPRGTINASPSKRGVYRAFKNYCLSSAVGMTEKDYPFNTNDGGRRAVSRFVLDFNKNDSKSRITWYGANTGIQAQLGTGKQSFRFSSAPFETVASDTHTVHCLATILIQGKAGLQPVAIDRILFHPFLDEDTKVIPSYAARYNDAPSSSLVEEAMIGLSKKWEPRTLQLDDLAYPPGAMLPVGNIDGLDEIRPCILKFDNAAAHYSRKISQYARQYLGAAVTFGPLYFWPWNSICERLFLNLSRYGFQQLPSSTGSNTADPLRPDFVGNALKNHVTWDFVLDLLDICVALYNATPSTALGGISPLTALRNKLHFGTFVPRPSVPLGPLAPRIGTTIEIKRIAGQAKKGAFRTPYVQLDKAHYGGECLAKRYDLIGTKVAAHINESDMRSFTIFSLDGRIMGELTCLDPRWARQKHSRAVRKEVNKLIAKGEMQMSVGDFVIEYLTHHLKQAKKDVQNDPKRVSKAATKLVEAQRQTGIDVSTLSPPSVVPRTMRRPIPGSITRPSWEKP